MNKTLRCRINERFSLELLKALNKICTDKTIPDNNSKIEMVKELLTRFNVDFSSLGPGTNRYAILIDGVVFKIALDKWGQRDNLNEFVMAKELQPYVIKVYEVNSNGLIMTCEYVTVIDKDEYASQREPILSILDDLSQSYLLGDVGYISKNFLNWGYNDAGELVILDFAYIYKIIAHEMKCNSPNCTHPYLEYNSSYSSLICPDCRKQYSFMDIRRKYSIKDEERYVKLTKELSYKTDEKKLVIETDEPEVIYNNPIVEEYEDEEYDYSKLTYSQIRKELEEKEVQDDEGSNIIELLNEPYYQVSTEDKNIFKYETVKSFKEEKTMSEFMKQLARIYQEDAKRHHKNDENPYARHLEEEKVEDTFEEEPTVEEVDPYDALIMESNERQAKQNEKRIEEKPFKKQEPQRAERPNKGRNEKNNQQPQRNNQQVNKVENYIDSTAARKAEVMDKVEAPERKDSTPKNNIPMRKPDEVINVSPVSVETVEDAPVVHQPKEEPVEVMETKIEEPIVIGEGTPINMNEETVEIVKAAMELDAMESPEVPANVIEAEETTEESEEDIDARNREIVNEIVDSICNSNLEEEDMQATEEIKKESSVTVSRNNPTGVIRKEANVEFSFKPASKKVAEEDESEETEMERMIRQQQNRMR